MANDWTLYSPDAEPDRFEESIANHAKWRAVAFQLLDAARLLWPLIASGYQDMAARFQEPDAGEGLRMRGPFYLLSGLAVENLLKAIIVKQLPPGASLVRRDKLDAGVKHHKLTSLCDRARVTLSPKDKAFLERLTKFVEWRGRYPVPNQRPAENDVTMTTTQDLRRIEEIMKTLDDRYNS